MKKRIFIVCCIFFAALTVYIVSCTNQVNTKQVLTGLAKNSPKKHKNNSSKPDTQNIPPAAPKGTAPGTASPAQPPADPEGTVPGAAPPAQPPAASEGTVPGTVPPAQPLDPAAKKQILFKRLTDAVLRFEEKIDVSDLAISCASQSDTTPEYRVLYEHFTDWLDEQNLFFFHLPLPKTIACTYKEENENEVAAYKLTYYVPPETVYSDYERVVTAFETFYKAVKKGMSQAEISYALYRELGKRTVYGENTGSKYQRTVCGAVLDGKGVCEDYSIGYKQLMHGVGIEVRCLEGDTRRIPDSAGNVAHMWNRVKLGDKWYNADATWDDNEWAESQLQAYSKGKYFLKSDTTFYGQLNHTLIYDKLLPLVPKAVDTEYENSAYIFYDGEKKSDPFYYKGYWYYFSYEDMGIYRSRFDGSEKKLLYRKMYHTDNDVYKPHWAKLHRIEFGADKIYFLDYTEQYGSGSYALYTLPYNGDTAAVEKIGAAPAPSQPLRPESDKSNEDAAGIAVLRTEIMFSKMKDAYFHGTESYFTPTDPGRTRFLACIQEAEAYVKSAPVDEGQAIVLYNQLRKARLGYGGLATSRP